MNMHNELIEKKHPSRQTQNAIKINNITATNRYTTSPAANTRSPFVGVRKVQLEFSERQHNIMFTSSSDKLTRLLCQRAEDKLTFKRTLCGCAQLTAKIDII
jgi:hypothetical protein